MKRRIVQHGCSSLTVTLPVTWIKKFGIKKGDDIQLEEKGSSVIISTDQSVASDKKVVDTTEWGVFTKNNLTHLYQLGYDEVEIHFDDDLTLQEITARVPECLGFEIIDQKKNTVYIKCIAHSIEEDFDILFRKSFQITSEMAHGVLETLGEQKYNNLKSLRQLEFLNNKFTMCCVRTLNKRGCQSPQKLPQIYDILKGLERIADEYKYICDQFINYDKKLSKDILNYFKEVNDYFDAFYHLYYKFDPALKKKIYTERKKLFIKGNELIQKAKGKEIVLIHHLLCIIDKTYDSAGEYFASIL